MHAEALFQGPWSLLDRLLRADKRACRLYNKLYVERLVVSVTKRVALSSLHCTQWHVDNSVIAEYVAQPRRLSVDALYCVSDLPVVVRFRAKCFVLDGHHRLASKIIQGQQHAKVYFWDLDTMLGRA